MKTVSFKPFAVLCSLTISVLQAEPPKPTLEPSLRAVDLRVGESTEVTFADGSRAKVRLLDVREQRDSMSAAVREARVNLEVNGRQVWLTSANYNLPQTVGGVQVDCPVTRGYGSRPAGGAGGAV